jgi:hypothetical protein
MSALDLLEEFPDVGQGRLVERHPRQTLGRMKMASGPTFRKDSQKSTVALIPPLPSFPEIRHISCGGGYSHAPPKWYQLRGLGLPPLLEYCRTLFDSALS